MPGYNKCTILTLATLVVCSALFGASSFGQQRTNLALERPSDRSEGSWHFGFDLLQMLLEDHGLQIRAELNEALAAPKESVIVIMGTQPAMSTNSWRRIIDFVLEGGTLLFASDNTFGLPGIGRFSQGPVTSENSSDQYQGFPDCLRIAPNASVADFSGVSEIVTNRSGWFVPDSVGWLEWDILASLPIDGQPAGSRGNAVLAIGRKTKSGGIAIMAADAGLFCNGMMWHGDNAVAAIRASELLCSGGQKTKLMFLADGMVMDSYHNRLDLTQAENEPLEEPAVPEPELTKALRLANTIAKEVAESNVLNEALRQRPRGVQPSRYFRGFLYLVAILILLAIIWALLTNRTLQAVFLTPRMMRSAYEMREHASSLADDFRNSAGYLARDFCWELTGSRHTADWQKYLASLMSSLHSPANGSLPNGVNLTRIEQHELMRIIDIACRGCHTRMSSQEFQLLGNSISKLRSKHRTQPLVAV